LRSKVNASSTRRHFDREFTTLREPSSEPTLAERRLSPRASSAGAFFAPPLLPPVARCRLWDAASYETVRGTTFRNAKKVSKIVFGWSARVNVASRTASFSAPLGTA
jgi:hypothetical protein